jgi:hypothetical protein
MTTINDQDCIRTARGLLVAIEHDDAAKNTEGLSQVLGGSGAGSLVTGTTAETTMAGATVPGGMLGSGSIRVVLAVSVTNNAAAKTFRVRLGGVIVATFSPASTAAIRATVVVFGRPAAGQVVFHLNPPGIQDMSGSGAAWTTAAVDMSVDQPLTVSVQLASGTDSADLVGWAAEILPAGLW